jgi:hypothetical protein
VATVTAAIVLLTPAIYFTIFKDENLTFSLSPSLLRPLEKNLQKKIRC